MQHKGQARPHSKSDDSSSGEPLEGSGFEHETPEEEFGEDSAAVPLTREEEAPCG